VRQKELIVVRDVRGETIAEGSEGSTPVLVQTATGTATDPLDSNRAHL
jgi:hypothetical protein